MTRFFSQDISQLGDPPDPSSEAITGLQPMEFGRAEAALRAQDKVTGQSRRILWRTGINGDTEWRSPNSNPATSGVGTHPTIDQVTTVGYAKFDVTPGCILKATCLYLPSGSTQPAGNNGNIGTQGLLHFITTWYPTSGSNETITYVMPLEGSTLDFGAEDTTAGGMQRSYRLETLGMSPPVDLDDVSIRNQWSRPKTVEIELAHVGACRVVDLIIYEVPLLYAMESEDPDDEWVNHIVSQGDPDGNAPEPNYPKEEREGTGVEEDQRLGSKQALHVVRNQRDHLGPSLFHWSNLEESSLAATATSISITGVSGPTSGFVNVLNTPQVGYNEDEPGWSMGCGGYNRLWLYNNPHVMGTADAEAVVPVFVKLYGYALTTAAVCRFHTSTDSFIEFEVPPSAAVDAFHGGWGFVKVGLNPDDHVVGQLLADVDAGSSLRFYSLQANIMVNFTPADSP